MAHDSAVLLTSNIRHSSCARRIREEASDCLSFGHNGLTLLDRIPNLAPQGPSPNPRYPRVFANRPSRRPFSNPKRRESPPARAPRLLQPRPRPPPALSGTEGRTVRLEAVAASWKKSGCPLVLLVHHGRHHQLRDGLRRTILSVSTHAIMLFFVLCARPRLTVTLRRV